MATSPLMQLGAVGDIARLGVNEMHEVDALFS